MSKVGVSIAVNLEHRDTRRVVLARDRIEDEDARLQPNSSVDLLRDRGLVAVELCRIDLDFSYLNVSWSTSSPLAGDPNTAKSSAMLMSKCFTFIFWLSAAAS